MDRAAVDRTVREAVAAMRAMPYEPSRGFKTLWPAMWCEYASIAIAEVLKVRGHGDWAFVQAHLPDDPSGHAWLEYPSDGGETEFTIDATLHQFNDHGEPFVGPGVTPAAARFTVVKFRGPWRDWRWAREIPLYAEFADATLRELDETADG